MGMLMTTAYILAMDTFGPITDNAGGIAEFSRAEASAREITDRLDAVGNTTKALTKGYAIASASLAAFLLFSAYIDKVNLILGARSSRQAGVELMTSVNLANVNVFVAALIGSMLVYFFSSLAIRAVGKTASAIIVEVRRQFREMPGIMDYTGRPDYARVVDITTKAALREMVAPGLVAVATPILVGVLLGYEAVAGLLMVGTIAGVLLATVLNNGGGAWDNAKKYIESGHLKDAAGNVLGKKTRRPRRGGRRRHGRRSVQGHRRPVAPRPGQAPGDDHAGPRPALHPLGRPGTAGRAPRARPAVRVRWTLILQAIVIGHRAGAHGVPADLLVRAPHRRSATCSAGTTLPQRRWPSRSSSTWGRSSRSSSTSGATGPGSCRPGWRRSATARSRGDPDRKLAWLIAATMPPAIVAGVLLNDFFEEQVRQPVLVAAHARRRRRASSGRPTGSGAGRPRWSASAFGGAFFIGCAQALALVPGISRSGISISAGLALGLTREAAARFSLPHGRPRSSPGRAPARSASSLAGEAGVAAEPGPLVVGFLAAAISGLVAIAGLLPLPAQPPDDRLRRLPPGARGDRRRLLPEPRRPGRRPMEVMKQLRQRAIRDLVEQRPIRTQQELAAALRDRGFRTTQATISRDIAELQLVKAHRDGVSVYALPPRLADADPTGEDRLRRLFRDLPVEIREAGLLLVLVTLPGLRARDRRLPRPRPLAGRRRLDRRRRHLLRRLPGPAGRCAASASAWSGSRRGRWAGRPRGL